MLGWLQVASLEQDYPALVSTFYMSYIQQDPDTSEVMEGSSQEPHRGAGQGALQALPSTHASADVVAAGSAEHPVVCVPRITFLYKLAPGIADKSFGELARHLSVHSVSLCKFTAG